MKKLLILISTFTMLSALSFGVEIIPEYFVMEKVLLPLSTAPLYTENNGSREVHAIQVDKKILESLKTTENPIYIYDSNSVRQIVRIGDYFVSSPNLSDVFVINKNDFEDNFYSNTNPDRDIHTTLLEEVNKINLDDVEESYGNYSE